MKTPLRGHRVRHATDTRHPRKSAIHIGPALPYPNTRSINVHESENQPLETSRTESRTAGTNNAYSRPSDVRLHT